MKTTVAYFSFALLLFAFSTPGHAQYSTSWWGVRVGANFASETFDSLPASATTSMKTGVIGGLAYEHWFDDTWGLDISALYDQKGVSVQYSANAQNRQVQNPQDSTKYLVLSGNDNYTLSYIEIPLVVKFAFGMGDIKPYIDAGPSLGILMGASESADGDLVAVPNLKTYLNSIDLSLFLGVGVADELYHGPMITFDAGYAVGLSKIYKSVPTDNSGNFARSAVEGIPFKDPVNPTSAKSSDIRVTLGIMWPIGSAY